MREAFAPPNPDANGKRDSSEAQEQIPAHTFAQRASDVFGRWGKGSLIHFHAALT